MTAAITGREWRDSRSRRPEASSRKLHHFGELTSAHAIAAKLTWAQVHAFRLTRHHLTGLAPKKDLVRVTGDIGGAQAQVMSAAELQIAVRSDCTVKDVRRALWQDKKLVKTWLMRGTLHLVPADDLPVFTAAMSSHLVRSPAAWLKYTQLTEREFTDVIQAIGDALDGQALTREELIGKVGKGRSERIQVALKSGWGGLLKPVARKGLLCFGPSRGQSVTFVQPHRWLGRWRDLDPEAALVEMGRRYLRAYGPATKNDFARWWGNWPGIGKAAWIGMADELAPVSVEGQRADILAADLDIITSAAPVSGVNLLPGFDPYLMGHSSRDHLFDAQYRWRVSRIAGWISPVVLLDGRVIATWTHQPAKANLVVSVKPFRRLTAATMKQVNGRAQEIASALGLSGATAKVAV